MKIKIEEKIERVIEVNFPMYRKQQDGWYYNFIKDEKTVIHIWATEGNYRIALQLFRADMITETFDCSKEEFEAAFDQVSTNFKSML